MKILILGGAGFLGTNMVLRCIEEPAVSKITVVDSLEPQFYSTSEAFSNFPAKVHFIKGDIRNEKLLKRIVPGQDVIYNFAAQSSHMLSIRDPLMDADINCGGNLLLLEMVRIYNPHAVVIYPSSSTVIGKALEPIVDESHPEKPLEIYSAHKSVVEKYYQIYHSLHGLKTVVLRFANLYGPFGKAYPEFCFVNYFIELARVGNEIKVFGAGEQARNVMHVEDATEILWIASREEELHGGVYFTTSPFSHSVLSIAEAIVSVFGKGTVRHVDWPDDRRLIEIGPVRFSSEKIRAVTGWQARLDLIAGLQKTREVLESSAWSVLL